MIQIILSLLGVLFILVGSYTIRKSNMKLLNYNNFIIELFIPITTMTIIAALMKNSQMVVGIIIGSNIALTLVEKGVNFLNYKTSAKKEKEQMFSIVSGVLYLYIANDYLLQKNIISNQINRMEGIVLIGIAIFYALIILRRKEIPVLLKNIYSKLSFKTIVGILIGSIFSIGGSWLIVYHQQEVTELLNIREYEYAIFFIGGMISFLIISIIKRFIIENKEIVERAVISTNIFNLLFVSGIAAVIHSIQVSIYHSYDMILLVFFSLISWGLNFIDEKWNQWKGSLLVTIYIGFIVYVVLR